MGKVSSKSPRSLTPRQTRFVHEYLFDLNATQAAKRAGYSHPNVQGSILLRQPIVAERVKIELANRCKQLKLSADWVLNRLQEEAVDSNNAASSRIRALELLGKYLGIFELGRGIQEQTFIFAED
jgi:phage terminase small subunit